MWYVYVYEWIASTFCGDFVYKYFGTIQHFPLKTSAGLFAPDEWFHSKKSFDKTAMADASTECKDVCVLSVALLAFYAGVVYLEFGNQNL